MLGKAMRPHPDFIAANVANGRIKSMPRANPTHAFDKAFYSVLGDAYGQLSPARKAELSEPLIFACALATQCVFHTHGTIYRFASDFSHALDQTPLDVKCSLLRETGEVRYLTFPDDIAEAYGMPGGAYACVRRLSPNVDELQLLVTTPGVSRGHKYEDTISAISMGLHFETVEQSIAAQRFSADSADNMRAIKQIRFLSRCMLYLQTGDPDLRAEKPLRERFKSTSKRAEYLKAHPDESEFPVVHVGFNFKKPVLHNVNQALVHQHLRFQPCGPGRTQLKLVWVTEHVRHYKNVKETDAG